MTFGSLFAGIGGIDLGLERAGMVCRWQSEIDPYACQVLAKHWPDIPNLGDIRDIDWTTVDRVDLVAGGYPCQPFSYANVSGHLSLGFGRVLGDLAEIGYDADWDCVPAAAVGAPHLRDRVFIIATRADMADTDRTLSEGGSSSSRGPTERTFPDLPSTRRPSWAPEPGLGRVAHGIPHRLDRLRALGNAVVPQVAEHLANIILRMDTPT
jgi:DNA (cytosine-5)-methyltransferase 1